MTMKNKIVDIIIIDDHPMVIEGLRSLLSSHSNMNVQATFTHGLDALEKIGNYSCSIILLDINLPDINGAELCERIMARYKGIKILGMSTYSEPSIIQQMIRNGAKGYLLKNASAGELMIAIQLVLENEVYFSPEIQKILAYALTREKPQLTRREKEVLALIAEGETTQQIGEKLFVSPLTIESHRRNLMQKFSVNNAPALIKEAMAQGFL